LRSSNTGECCFVGSSSSSCLSRSRRTATLGLLAVFDLELLVLRPEPHGLAQLALAERGVDTRTEGFRHAATRSADATEDTVTECLDYHGCLLLGDITVHLPETASQVFSIVRLALLKVSINRHVKLLASGWDTGRKG
jgi:hypothetical protein